MSRSEPVNLCSELYPLLDRQQWAQSYAPARPTARCDPSGRRGLTLLSAAQPLADPASTLILAHNSRYGEEDRPQVEQGA